MNVRSDVFMALVVTVAVQFFILTGMVVKASMPLWTGTEVRLKTIPVDPRSMFRGNYARLNYAISTLPEDALAQTQKRIRTGEVVYVSLRKSADDLYEYAGASLAKPDSGIFLRGRANRYGPPYRLEYGIEAFFAPKEKALQLEKDLRNGGVAVLMVSASGRATLATVEPENSGE